MDFLEDLPEEPSGEYHMGMMEEGTSDKVQQYGLYKETNNDEQAVHFIRLVTLTCNHIC